MIGWISVQKRTSLRSIGHVNNDSHPRPTHLLSSHPVMPMNILFLTFVGAMRPLESIV